MKLGKNYDAPKATEIHQAFWDIANIYDSKNLNELVKHQLGLAQQNLHIAWKLQTHMNELGEFEKGGN
jgi:hypothetical protein